MPINWEYSSHFGGELNGSPLEFDYARWSEQIFNSAELGTISDVNQDPDGDGISNFLEYVFGSSPFFANSTTQRPETSVISIDGSDYLALSLQRSSFDLPIEETFQASSDLEGWSNLPSADYTKFFGSLNADGTRPETYRSNDPVADYVNRFYRLEFTIQD